jgi:hypothetical protein
MYLDWTSHISDQGEKERHEKYIRSCKPLLDQLVTILENRKNSLERSELDSRMFDQPNWDYRQAFMNGKKSAISDLIKLINLDQQKESQ